tara:strand:- start:11845 stop:12732 length:888 start_codon:yes stop_codon:yes gene_type:complete
MLFYNKLTLVVLIALTLFFSCAEGPKRESSTVEKQEEKRNTNLFEIDGKVFSIPSPIQTAFLLKDAGASYSSELLNPTINAASYETKSKKALNLGVFGANLGYATIYDQTQDAISYMAVTKRISGELGIADLFDKRMITRFEANLGDQDSLLALISDAFKSSDQFLKNNKQNDLSVLILAGGWVETLYFATQLTGTTNNQLIRNRIGEQKITIKNLINLLLPYQSNPDVMELINKLNELKDLYNDVDFTYTYEAPTTDVENKVTTINSVSNVNMTDNQLQDIIDQVSAIRTFIIK